MSRTNCKTPTAPNGEMSKLYIGLLKKCGDHLLANLVYATYIADNVGALMDLARYKKSYLQEHTAEDVFKFLGVSAIAADAARSLLSARNTIPGATENLTNAKEALTKAELFNLNSKGKVAYVVQHGNLFDIIIENKDSRTLIQVANVLEQLKVWETLENEFLQSNIDINTDFDFMSDIANPINARGLLQYLNSLKRVSNNILVPRDIQTLLTVSKLNGVVLNLINRLGGIELVALLVYDAILNPTSVSLATMNFYINALSHAKNSYSVDINNLTNAIILTSNQFLQTSREVSIKKQLDKLHLQFNIDADLFLRNSKDIEKLSDAAADAIIVLERLIRNVLSRYALTLVLKLKDLKLIRQLELLLNSIMKEIEAKLYYAGLLTFLNQANLYAQAIEKDLTNIPNTGTKMEYVARRAEVLTRALILRDSYNNIASAIANIDKLLTDQSITDADKDSLKQVALQLKDSLDNLDVVLKDIRKDTMIDLCEEVLGEDLYNGVATAKLIDGTELDSSIFDYLYSVGRQSNPLVAAMGTIIRDALDLRDEAIKSFSLEIRKATNNLYKSGSDSSFMFDETGHIISDIDWGAYETARASAIALIYRQAKINNLSKLDIREAIELWEEDNTEDRVVDLDTGRTERVPNYNFRNLNALFDPATNQVIFNPGVLTLELLEYYNRMMKLKGLIGSLLPAYALKLSLYLPALIRKSWLDIMADKSLPWKKKILMTLDRIAFWRIRQDDTLYGALEVVLDGDTYTIHASDFDNTPLRNIPIFYLNKLKGDVVIDKKTGLRKERWTGEDELLRDFSAGLLHLAGTAVNYYAMNTIKDTVEFMGSYIKGIDITATKDGNKMVDAVEGLGAIVAKVLRLKGASNSTSNIIDGFIEQHIYGVRTKDTGLGWRILQGLINYSSVKGLAMNVKGAISNYMVGEALILIEAASGGWKGGELFNIKDYIYALMKMVGKNTIGTPGVFMDFMTNNKSSKSVLLAEMFDPVVDNFSEESHKRYYKSAFRLLFGGFNIMGLYALGEHLIHYTVMYAMLNHQKVYVNGELVSLEDALILTDKEDGNKELIINPDATLDLSGTLPVTKDFLIEMKRRIRFANLNCHGSMNAEDKGLIHQRVLGRAVMNFRLWMVEHYSRRWRGRHWDATTKSWRKGYRLEANLVFYEQSKFIYNWIKDFVGFLVETQARWPLLDEVSKLNVRRCLAENALILSLLTLSFALGEPDKHKKEWWTRMWIYQVNRMLLDEKAATAPGALLEGKTLLNSPIASVSTINGFLYPIMGLGDIDDTVKSGRYKGWNKYTLNFLRYTVPFWKQIEQLRYMDEDEDIFLIFNSSNNYR